MYVSSNAKSTTMLHLLPTVVIRVSMSLSLSLAVSVSLSVMPVMASTRVDKHKCSELYAATAECGLAICVE